MMKRKAADDSIDGAEADASRKRLNTTAQPDQCAPFHDRVFSPETLEELTKSYSESKPYKHGVISNLVSPDLLHDVRSEIQNHLTFTPKETDIYKIHQSGDLANLDGLDHSSSRLLPNLLQLRDALYSRPFREHLSTITGSGALSGRKTDMAINVYTPGCHLLCHDDVIGSRRVSYILYLTDPDIPWKAEWGGALRLYPTVVQTSGDGKVHKIPSPDPEVSIPPAFNQLAFFAVQPGESFHDVEEVYASQGQEEAKDEVRIRTAISGWYHIPQEGEEGFVEGLEEKLADKSSLRQLEGKADEFDLPKTNSQTPIAGNDSSFSSNNNQKTALSSQEGLLLSEDDLTFLIKYIAPTYLTPDTLGSVSEVFTEQWSLTLDSFLTDRFSQSLRDYISTQESQALPIATSDIEKATPWTVARPPHKHRFLFQQIREPRPTDPRAQSPLQDLLENLLPSVPFYKWLQLATGQTISSHNLIARRFRRGKDYTLATGYEEDESQLEVTLAITPSSGWEPDMEVEDDADSHVVAGDVGETAEDSAVGKLVNEAHVGKLEETAVEVDNRVANSDVGEAEVAAETNKPVVEQKVQPVVPGNLIANAEEHVGKPEEPPVDADNHVANSDVGEAEVAAARISKPVVEEKEDSVEPGNLVANADVEEVKGSPTGAGISTTAGVLGNSDQEPVDDGKRVSNSDVGEAGAAPAEGRKSTSVGTVSKSKKASEDVEAGKLFTNSDAGEEGGSSNEVDKRGTDDDGSKTEKASSTVNEPHVINDQGGGVGDVDEAGSATDTVRKSVASDDAEVGGDLAEASDGAPGLDIGGYLAYMAGDDTDHGIPDEKSSDQGLDLPSNMSTGARSSGFSTTKSDKPTKADPAVYQTADQGDEDDGVLFSMPAGWNKLGIVLRDKGTLRFVKYVSQQAKGDRWDVCGEYAVVDQDTEVEGGEVLIEADQMGDSDVTTEQEEETTSDDY